MWILDFLPFWVFHLVLLAGVVGLFVSFFVGSIPLVNKYLLPVKIGSAFLLVCGLYMEGGISNQERWEAKVAEAKIEMAKKDAASAEASTKVVTKYITKIEIVKCQSLLLRMLMVSALSLTLSSCSTTVPVAMKFPTPPEALMKEPPALNSLVLQPQSQKTTPSTTK